MSVPFPTQGSGRAAHHHDACARSTRSTIICGGGGSSSWCAVYVVLAKSRPHFSSDLLEGPPLQQC